MMRCRSSTTFSVSYQELPDKLEQGGCDVEMKICLIFTNHLYHVHCELGLYTSDFGYPIEAFIAEIKMMYGCCQKLGSDAHMFCFAVQFSSSTIAFTTPTESNIFKGSEGNEKKLNEIIFDIEKQCLKNEWYWWNSKGSPYWVSLHHDISVEHAVHYWQICLYVGHLFLNGKYHISMV